jgi:ABC-type Fe3+-hydroxamate transport system substrate-binding protein
MWAVIMAFGIVGGLIKLAYGQAMEPTIKPAWRKEKLVRLASIPMEKLTLDQAEDGAVLARENGAKELEKRFRAKAAELKAQMKSSTRRG